MKRNIFLIILSAILLIMGACSDEFLESEPKNSVTADQFYETNEQMFSALIAAYDPLQWCNAISTFVPLGEIRSDNAKTGGGGEGDQPDMQAVEDFTNTEVNVVSEGIWSKNYTGIYRANLVINAEVENDVVNVYKAEARFLRAWYHFDNLRTYGPCPVIDQTVYPADYEFTRNTRQEVNEFIETDLLAAIPVLEDEFGDQMKGRITKTAAQALLGKVYLYWADWNNDDAAMFDKAADQFEAVMSSGKYQLFTDYSQLYAPHMENNSESIFEIQRSTKSGWTSWGNTNGTEGNFWAQFCGPRGFSSNHPDIEGGWGFLLPQQSLFDYFLPDDTIRRDAVVFTYDELVTEPNSNLPEDQHISWDTLQYNQPDFQGYAQKKFALWKDYEYSGGRALNRPGNERVIRYGEIYLLLAECYLRGTQGSEAEAKELINTLRQHHVAMGDEDFDTVDDLIAKYPDRFSTTLDVLWYERRCELAGEGDRWFDLVRTGRADEVMGALYPNSWDDEDIYLPIGLTELGNAGGSLDPYPSE